MAYWSSTKIEEQLIDFRYRRQGLHTLGREWDIYNAGSSFHGYAPTAWRPLRDIFRKCSVGPDDVLLDYGSGKGRTVIWAAANFRLRRTVGIELDERLHAEAKENLERWSGRLLCRDIVLSCTDATQFEVPDDVTITYFGNPFVGDTFKKVISQIKASLARKPRSLQILYYHPRMHDFVIDAGFCVDRGRINPPYEWTIYRNRPYSPGSL